MNRHARRAAAATGKPAVYMRPALHFEPIPENESAHAVLANALISAFETNARIGGKWPIHIAVTVGDVTLCAEMATSDVLCVPTVEPEAHLVAELSKERGR